MYAFNTIKSPEDDRDYVYEHLLPTYEYIPPVLDLRPELCPIRDQARQGSCSAQSASCMKEWQEHKERSFDKHMSPQFIYNNRANQDGGGMSARDTMKILQKIGSVPESIYKYGLIEPKAEIHDSVLNVAKKYKIKEYAQINTIDGLKKALHKNGPCWISFPVYNYLSEFWMRREQDRKLGGHAVTVVGYDKEGFIIRNSWGDRWGNEGYTKFLYSQWGNQWECWSTVDLKTGEVIETPSWFTRLFNWFESLFKI
jgi:C1A family cysteine protease